MTVGAVRVCADYDGVDGGGGGQDPHTNQCSHDCTACARETHAGRRDVSQLGFLWLRDGKKKTGPQIIYLICISSCFDCKSKKGKKNGFNTYDIFLDPQRRNRSPFAIIVCLYTSYFRL